MAVRLLCVTPNAALDRTLIVPRLDRGSAQRPTKVLQAAGGKGMNVARAARVLGAPPLCAAMIGGHSGRLFADLAAAEGLHGVWQWRAAETRICTSIVDEARGETTSLYERGEALDPGEWPAFCALVTLAASSCDVVCLSGSLPSGAPTDAPGDMITALAQRQRPVWVDTSGEALRRALDAHPFGVKINAEEAGDLLGSVPADTDAANRAAGHLLSHGVQVVVITIGAAGALLRQADGAWRATPPPIEAASAVGSGDSFLAGLALAFAQGRPAAEALRLAVAAGAANACHPGAGQFTRDEVDELAAATDVASIE